MEAAPTLTFDAASRRWQAAIPLAGVQDGAEYKLASRQGGGWAWQPGPNRALPLSPAPDGTVSLRDAWISSRDGTGCVTHATEGDPWLESSQGHLRHRFNLYNDALTSIVAHEGGLDAFSRSYERFGFNRAVRGGAPGIHYREWAPGAQSACLVGDFNSWVVGATPCTKDSFGFFSTFLPDAPDGTAAIPHDTFVKLSLIIADGSRAERVPAWIRYAVYDPKLNELVGKYWAPPASARHVWAHARPTTAAAADYAEQPGFDALPCRTAWTGTDRPPEDALFATPAVRPGRGPARSDPAHSGLRIYEAHVGMSSEEGTVASYRYFADSVLPRIAALGYNCVQLMAIMEHAYYGSFGYHVNMFMAPSSRFGTPEDLKYLVDACHARGLLCIMDAVHSHASKNVNDGLNRFDGTDHHYFHAGAKGEHALWDSRLFDYSKVETQRLLLSSLRMFVDEFRFDGFRFDGVTSMMYTHHGLGVGFSGNYTEYFGESTDLSAMAYLMLANSLLHTLSPPALSIAEDVSGMPTLGRPVWEGGVGFDLRLAMAIPDVWIKYLKEKGDEEWDLDVLSHTLVNRRWQEKCVAYAESHDQALVGDKTMAFWLMDKEMYWHMSGKEVPRHVVIDRGMALHKMIRLVTYGLGGEAWLNFMGNEFGHPEWVDFPRAGNNWSYHHCRRQWSLVDNEELLYRYLNAWDGGMHALEEAFPWLLSRDSFVSTKHFVSCCRLPPPPS